MTPSIRPRLQRLASFDVAGLTARTDARSESDPANGHISRLWGRFFDERLYDRLPQRHDDARLYGVYSDYDRSAYGSFHFTTGVSVAQCPASIRIESGTYLVLEAHGRMPDMVRDAWLALHAYVDAHPEIERCYKSDFEAYTGPDHVAIHVGVKV